jgi:hypothetical protein
MNPVRFLLIALILSACQGAHPQDSSAKSDREKAGLFGPVATVKVESTALQRKNDKWVESERDLYEQTEYDKLGTIVRQKKIPIYGDPAPCHLQYKYDDKHRTTEVFCTDGSRERIVHKYTYEDDRFGNWIKQVSSIPDGEDFRAQSTLYRKITYFE